MPQYLHGVRVTEVNEGARPIRTANSAIVGVVIAAPKGPVNAPTLIAGSRAKWLTTFGNIHGTSQPVADAIFDQIGALCVVVNVLDPATHKAAVAAAEYTFDATSDLLTVADKFIYNPVVKSQDNVTTYVIDDDYTFNMDTGEFTRVAAGGIAAGAAVNINYDVPDASLITDANVIGSVDAGTGKHTGLQALLTAKTSLGIKPRILGAPGFDSQAVAAELVSLSDQLRAFSYVRADGAETAEAAVTYRNNLGSKRVMVIWPDFKGYDVDLAAETTLLATARALGTRALIDNTIGWHKTISNVPVKGVTGLSKDVPWDLQNPNTIANYLNSKEVTTLINEKGYRFWGSRTCSADPLFAFETATRTGDILADTIAEAHLWAIDKPMSKTLINDILEGINAKFRELVAFEYVVGATAWLDPDLNTEQMLSDGQLNISYDYTPVPPLEQLGFIQKITTSYLSKLVA